MYSEEKVSLDELNTPSVTTRINRFENSVKNFWYFGIFFEILAYLSVFFVGKETRDHPYTTYAKIHNGFLTLFSLKIQKRTF